jgi:hypothetical protein
LLPLISYYGLSTTITNALGHKKTTTKNIIGKVIRIDEPKGAWLTHHYDSIGNLIKTIIASRTGGSFALVSGLSGADKSTNSIILHSNKILLFVFKVWQGCLLNST